MTSNGDAANGYLIRQSDAPAPWATVPAAVRAAVDLEGVRAAFQRPRNRLDVSYPDHLRPSAVLVLLYDRAGAAHVVLGKRSTQVGSHRGDIAFPGGVLDPGETAEEGALREAWEEVGIDPAVVDVVGRLGAVPALHTGFRIDPVVGVTRAALRFTPSPHEIDSVIEVAVTDLLDPARYREEVWQAPGGSPSAIPFFGLPDGGTVWGATAAILVELLTALTS